MTNKPLASILGNVIGWGIVVAVAGLVILLNVWIWRAVF